MKPTNVTGYPFSNGDRLTAVSVNQICSALDAIQDYNDTIKEFEDLVEENTEEIKSEINRVAYDDVSVNGIAGEIGAGKAAIASAINAKGGSASATESFAELADDISKIDWNPNIGCVWDEGYEATNVLDVLRNAEHLLRYEDNIIEQCSLAYFRSFTNLRSLILDNVFSFKSGDLGVANLQQLRYLSFKKIQSFNFANNYATWRYVTFNLPTCTNFGGYAMLGGNYNIKNLILGTVTSLNLSVTPQYAMRNCTLGVGTNINLDLHLWDARDVIAEGSDAITELNDNLYNNLLTKLYDHSNDGQTRTLRIGWLANVTPENIAYANAKGWTLTT